MQAHHHGLEYDLHTLLKSTADRRRVLRWLGAGAACGLPLAGCGGSDATPIEVTTTTSGASAASTTATGTAATAATASSTASCSVIPEETAGPYPGDGSNSNASGIVNALALSGIVRSDIRASIAGASGVAAGVPLTVRLQLVNTNNSCASLAGYAIYLWHCDRDGNYSLYSANVTKENYLRGVQETDSSGSVSFTTIFPGCYAGRMPHIHFEVYPSLAKAVSAASKLKTSQLTFPMATLKEAYTASGYATSVSNLAQMSYATDNVFSDGTALQMADVSGTVATGYSATLQVGIAA